MNKRHNFKSFIYSKIRINNEELIIDVRGWKLDSWGLRSAIFIARASLLAETAVKAEVPDIKLVSQNQSLAQYFLAS